MNLREIVVCVYSSAFLIALIGIALIPEETWKYIADWQKITFAFYILVGFCGVLIAYWVYDDGSKIDHLTERLSAVEGSLQKRIFDLEEKIEKSS
jgi:predicted membrane channel-forming protein YqfA (hemolysin III family)